MDDNDPDRVAITEQVIKQCPPASPGHLSDEDYQRDYIKPWHLIGMPHLRGSIKSHSAIYCRSCMEKKPRRGMRAWRFFVSHEDDDLGNFPALCHLECLHCGNEQYVPLKTDPRVVTSNPFEQYNPQSAFGQMYGAGAQQAQNLPREEATRQSMIDQHNAGVDTQRLQEIEARMMEHLARDAAAQSAPPVMAPTWYDEAAKIGPKALKALERYKK